MKKLRNILAMLMVFVMLVAVMPMNVFAEGDGTPTEISEVKITSNITELKAGESITDPKLTVEEDNVTVTFGQWYKGDADAGEKFEEGSYTYTFTIAPKNNAQFADTLKVTLDGKDATADATATTNENEKAYKSAAIEVKKAEDNTDNTDSEELKKAKDDAKKAVEDLENLTPEEKEAEKGKIDAAKTVDDVTKAKDAAVAADTKKAEEKKKEEEKKALAKAKEDAKTAVDKLDKLLDADKKSFKDKIDEAKDKAAVDKILKEAKAKANPTPTPVKTVKVVTIGNGSASVDDEYAIKGQKVIVTAKPYSGYAVARVYLKYAGITKNINTYYNGYYYDGRYYGRYNDYYEYLDVYKNSSYYSRKYDSYRDFLRHEYPSHYRYYEDYDWYDRYWDDYDYRYFDRYDNYYYKYLAEYRRNYSDRYDSYEDYLKVYHYPHYRDYYNYRYDYNWYNRYGYNTSDTFEMPASEVTVYVEFTDAYPYYYDDYYYYRYYRDKKDKEEKAKEKAKEEEKVVEEKTPQVYEASATINVGSNVFTKVNKNVTTQHQMDVAAYVKNGRVMLPLRYVAEALGLQVSWVPETKTVIIWDLTQRVEIPIKSNKMIVNGVTYTSDVKPEINSSRTMLPIANVARALGLIDGTDIIWDPVLKQVKLTRRVISK